MIATCPESKTLRDFAVGKLSDGQSDDVIDHIRDCQECQQRLATIDSLDDTMVGQLRDSTFNDSFRDESDCQTAMAKALGALAGANDCAVTEDLALPRSIGEYEIVRQIGRGGMGSVYLANHTKLNRKVAIKVLAANRISDPRMHERFKTEMRAIGSLSHPNIVTAHDAREVDGVAMLVTEWIDGLDLREILHRVGPLSIENACAITCQVAEALSYVQQQGLVHRDMKPSNVMINRDGGVKLLDLGLARLLSGDDDRGEATATGQAIGTADYVAPEQVNAVGMVDIRADIYGLGCTLFKLLTGRAPFEGPQHQTAFSKMAAHVSETPPPVRSIAPQVPAAVAGLIDRMLAKSPEDRPSSPDQIVRALTSFAGKADLGELIRTAQLAHPSAENALPAVNVSPSLPQGFWQRMVPFHWLIATGLAGLLVGFFAGIIITIRHSDGSSTEIDAPDNTKKVAISPNGDVSVELGEMNGEAAAKSQIPDAERISGVWSVESAAEGENSKATLRDALMVFHEPNFSIFEGKRCTVFGSMILEPKSHSMKLIELTGERNTKQAKYQFLSDGRLAVSIDETGRQSNSNDNDSSDEPASGQPVMYMMSKLEVPSSTASMLRFSRDPENLTLMQALSMHQSWLKNLPNSEQYAAALQGAQAANDANESNLHLKQMGIAFHNFLNVYKVFPASAADHMYSGSQGKKVMPHSWRVAILPFIEHQDLYEQYRFDEVWDSEHNSTLLSKMPEVYRHPAAPKDTTFTGYIGFVGEGTALGGSEGVALRDITDGTSNTLLLAEAKTEIPWTKPEDFTLDPFPALDSFGKDFIRVGMADGAVKSLQPLSEESIRSAAVGNDGKYPRHNL